MNGPVGALNGLAIDLHRAGDQIAEPRLAHLHARVQWDLHPPVEAQRRIRHLDEQQHVLGERMRSGVEVRARAQEQDVRLQLGVVFRKGHRVLDPHDDLVAQP